MLQFYFFVLLGINIYLYVYTAVDILLFCDGETNPSFTAGPAAQSRDQVNPFHRCNIGLHFPRRVYSIHMGSLPCHTTSYVHTTSIYHTEIQPPHHG